ncbi:MAG TPA: transposase [Solirubrobacteraceae bacterium]|nr:transposase [Solirubrobacteraceae bacterium]
MANVCSDCVTEYSHFRYRLYPTVEQARALGRWCGCARAIYNAGLQQRQIAYRDCGVSLGYGKQGVGLGDLKRAVPWLAEPHSDVLQQALRDLDRAYRNFFAGRARFPRYHKRSRRDSFRIQNRERDGIRVRRLNRRWGELVIPKLGRVRFRWSRKPIGNIKHLTVSRDSLGWHVSLCCEHESAAAAGHPRGAVGIDRGVTNTVALSTGELRSCPPLPPRQAARLRRLTRKAGRQETARRGRPNDERRRSFRHQRTLDALARLRAREARIRRDFSHKLTTDLAKNHGLVAIEALRVHSMTRSAKGTVEEPGRNVRAKARLNRAILAQGWGELARMLDYKLARNGGTLISVPAAYTSRTCAACETIDEASRRGDRFHCKACGHTTHADVNAARVILARATGDTQREDGGRTGRRSAGSPPGEVSRGALKEPRTTQPELAHAT